MAEINQGVYRYVGSDSYYTGWLAVVRNGMGVDFVLYLTPKACEYGGDSLVNYSVEHDSLDHFKTSLKKGCWVPVEKLEW